MGAPGTPATHAPRPCLPRVRPGILVGRAVRVRPGSYQRLGSGRRAAPRSARASRRHPAPEGDAESQPRLPHAAPVPGAGELCAVHGISRRERTAQASDRGVPARLRRSGDRAPHADPDRSLPLRPVGDRRGPLRVRDRARAVGRAHRFRRRRGRPPDVPDVLLCPELQRGRAGAVLHRGGAVGVRGDRAGTGSRCDARSSSASRSGWRWRPRNHPSRRLSSRRWRCSSSPSPGSREIPARSPAFWRMALAGAGGLAPHLRAGQRAGRSTIAAGLRTSSSSSRA